ncbi:MAG: hypothetical protein DRP45_10010 [Candidatus Zixiibacteriota bacterium]|nr:MAG: hypothetical protein DRP45_10010 [candidate division Zixibacteria bacterium]
MYFYMLIERTMAGHVFVRKNSNDSTKELSMATRRKSYTRRPTRRTTTRRASMGGNQWTRQEIAFMRKYYRNNETAWVARQLGRTVYSIRYKASDLSIKKSRPSVWRGNTGVTKPAKRTRTTKKTNWRATSRRTTRVTRRPKSRRTTRRTAKKRY